MTRLRKPRRTVRAACLATLLSGVTLPALTFAGPTMIFECERDLFLGDQPASLQADYTIRLTIEPRDTTYWFDSGIWEVADLPVAESEVELNFTGLGALVEPSTSGLLRQFAGDGNLLDEWSYRAPGTNVINVEDHVVVDFGVFFTTANPDLVTDYLAHPADADLALANWSSTASAQCIVRMRRLDRAPNFPLTQLRAFVRSVTLEGDPAAIQDADGDGQVNADDNCPDRFNPGQDNADGDLVGDACDTTFSRQVLVENVPGGDTDAFWNALSAAHSRPPGSISEIRLAGDIPLAFHTGDGLPTLPGPPGDQPPELWRLERDVRIVGARANGAPSRLTATDEVGGLRLATVQPGARLTLRNVEISGLDTGGDGGVIQVEAGGSLVMTGTHFRNNRSAGDGGAVHFAGGGHLRVDGSRFHGNTAERGGALFIDAPQSPPGAIVIEDSHFGGNDASQGCDIHSDLADTAAVLNGLVVNHDCGVGNALLAGEHLTTATTLHANTGPLIETASPWRMLTTALHQGTCIGSGLVSEGWNFASDPSCALDQPTDLEGVDPGFHGPGMDGLRTPGPGSPLIDAGPAGLVNLSGRAQAVLPCGWKDATGLGRPQDGNGDGSFECDIGAVEVAGTGAIGPGHSGAFYNPQRSGEGQYVEILDDDRAVIYTFTYRPGSGPAWFLTIADIVGNSLVSNTTVRPTGTVFGSNFNAGAIWRGEWGGMSMVFPDCGAAPPAGRPGNTVYSGSRDGGWEPLVTVAQRLTHVAGCPGVSPGAKAGLSGSFYDPARSGEGLVVQWLPNGDVLAIMFTYGLQGEQFWMFGTGTPSGNSVTLEVSYPAGDATWGGDFDPNAVGLESWGTFTLDYQDCDKLQFSYSGIFPWGSATRNYQRLSKLAGTACPAF